MRFLLEAHVPWVIGLERRTAMAAKQTVRHDNNLYIDVSLLRHNMQEVLLNVKEAIGVVTLRMIKALLPHTLCIYVTLLELTSIVLLCCYKIKEYLPKTYL